MRERFLNLFKGVGLQTDNLCVWISTYKVGWFPDMYYSASLLVPQSVQTWVSFLPFAGWQRDKSSRYMNQLWFHSFIILIWRRN